MANQMKREEMRGERPRVGPADPAVVREKLKAYEADVKSSPKLYQGKPAAPAKPAQPFPSGRGGRQRLNTVDSNVDDALRGGGRRRL